MVLLRQQRRGHQDRYLLAGLYGDKGGAQGHFGFAEAYIAADDAIHGLVGFQIRDHLFDGGCLIRSFFKGEACLECAVFRFARQHPRAQPCGSARVQIQQLCSDIANALRRLAARLLPLLAAQLMQRRRFRRRPRIARHQVQ